MTVAVFLQPDYNTQSGTAYPLAIDASMAVMKRIAAAFAPHAQSTPNMTVRVDAGTLQVGVTLTEVAGQNTGTITAPVGNPRIDRIVLDSATGAVSVVTGTPAGSPSAPAIPAGKIPVAQVLLQTSSTSIANSMITDERVPGRSELGALGAEGTSPVSDPAQPTGLIWVPQYPRSLVINPFFQVNQRAVFGTYADDSYTLDGWYVLNQSNPITPTQQTAQENGQATNLRLTQSNASAQRFGIATILESKDAIPLRGRQITFRPRVRISASQVVRIALLEWTGAADDLTSDVVNNWTSGSFTAGGFFNSTTMAVLGVGSKTPGAAAWTDMDALTVTVGSSCNNLIATIWMETTAAQNFTLDIGKVRLVPGAYAGDILVPSYTEDFLECARRFARFNWDSDGIGGMPGGSVGYVATTTTAYFYPAFAVPMRANILSADISALNIGNLVVQDGSVSRAGSSISVNTGGSGQGVNPQARTTQIILTTASGLTAGRAGHIAATSVADIKISKDL